MVYLNQMRAWNLSNICSYEMIHERCYLEDCSKELLVMWRHHGEVLSKLHRIGNNSHIWLLRIPCPDTLPFAKLRSNFIVWSFQGPLYIMTTNNCSVVVFCCSGTWNLYLSHSVCTPFPKLTSGFSVFNDSIVHVWNTPAPSLSNKCLHSKA